MPHDCVCQMPARKFGGRRLWVLYEGGENFGLPEPKILYTLNSPLWQKLPPKFMCSGQSFLLNWTHFNIGLNQTVCPWTWRQQFPQKRSNRRVQCGIITIETVVLTVNFVITWKYTRYKYTCFCGWPPDGASSIRSAQSVLKLSRRTV